MPTKPPELKSAYGPIQPPRYLSRCRNTAQCRTAHSHSDDFNLAIFVKNLFDRTAASEIETRLERLRPDTAAQWGRMNVAQAMTHCRLGLEMAVGDLRPPRMLVGRLFGRLIKRLALGDEKPMRKNTPTVTGMQVADARELDVERQQLRAAIDRLVSVGRAGCTTHPHAFFGPLTPDEWGVLMYKHLDHHLRQFGV
jgi:hypothetical protein